MIKSKNNNGEPDYILEGSAWLEVGNKLLWIRDGGFTDVIIEAFDKTPDGEDLGDPIEIFQV